MNSEEKHGGLDTYASCHYALVALTFNRIPAKIMKKTPGSVILFRIRDIVLTAVALFFLYLGIQTLVYAYKLNDPFSFVMTFFASNFIILISSALGIGFIYRLIESFHKPYPKKD